MSPWSLKLLSKKHSGKKTTTTATWTTIAGMETWEIPIFNLLFHAKPTIMQKTFVHFFQF